MSVAQAVAILKDCGHQEELIKILEGQKDKALQEKLAAQIIKLNQVTPTGMKSYLERGRKLLKESMLGVNPFDKYKPEVPTGVFLKVGEPDLDKYEQKGIEELPYTGFVLIAGGLGERLGYSGIKVDLPVCTIEEDYCYLKYYAQYALACKQRAM